MQKEASQKDNRLIPRNALSLLVEQCGNCTAARLGNLGNAETRALIRHVFFGEGQWEDVQADAGGSVMPLAVEAEHRLFGYLRGEQVFRELFGEVLAQWPISTDALAKYIYRILPGSDPARTFVDTFATIVICFLSDVFDGSLSVTLPAASAESGRSASTALMLYTHRESSLADYSQGDKISVAAENTSQLPLSQLLTTYCDFRQSQAPSLSERDKSFLRLFYLWGKDLRSISRASSLTYQRVQQIIASATGRLQNDLLAHESYRLFWNKLHHLCVVTPGALSCFVAEVLGDQAGTMSIAAVARFLQHALEIDDALDWYQSGRIKLRCCKGIEAQTEAVVAYAREVRCHRRGPVSEDDVAAVYMWILAHSGMPSSVAQTVATDLLASVPTLAIADELETVLKRLGRPTHFDDLARCLDDMDCGETIDAEYVHAVLGRDGRFAWAGLGTYALAEWGYPRETNILGVVLYLIRSKRGGVTLGEVFDFMFREKHYHLRPSSVRQALRMAEGRQLKKTGTDLWNEFVPVQENSEVM